MISQTKNVLIISPESWGKSKISKHHYALAFAKKGCKVFFLNLDIGKDKKDEDCLEHPEIRLIYFNISKQIDALRFHNRFLYNLILKYKVSKTVKNYPSFDLVVSFDCNGVFTNLSNFRGKKTIFFPVDQVDKKFRDEYKGFDLLISISPIIVGSFPKVENVKLFHHGLSSYFLDHIKNSQVNNREKELKRIAYIGNLLIGPILDKSNIIKIVEENPNIEFHFFGAYSGEGNNLGGNLSEETLRFINFLKNTCNCFLHGIVPSNSLPKELNRMDAFLICYDYRFDKNKCSNSHKILEYLSTGKPIISTRISMYDNLDLFPMLDTFDNSTFPDFFKNQILNWNLLDSKELKDKRVAFAMENSYENHVKDIQLIIS